MDPIELFSSSVIPLTQESCYAPMSLQFYLRLPTHSFSLYHFLEIQSTCTLTTTPKTPYLKSFSSSSTFGIWSSSSIFTIPIFLLCQVGTSFLHKLPYVCHWCSTSIGPLTFYLDLPCQLFLDPQGELICLFHIN